jgi:hypothetical protein
MDFDSISTSYSAGDFYLASKDQIQSAVRNCAM